MTQFVSLKTFKTPASRATSLDHRRRRHGSRAPTLQRGGVRQLRGHRATAAVSPLLKEVYGCGGHSVVRELRLNPLRTKIKRFAVPNPKEIRRGDDKENRNGKRGRKARPEAKSPPRLVSVECNPAPDAEHRLRGPWFPIVVDRLLRERDVCEMVAVDRSTLWRWVSTGLFPAPIRIGPAAVRWRLSAVQEWMASK